MSNFKAIGLVKLSIKDIVLQDKENAELVEKSIGCYIKINQKIFDIILFNKKEPTICNLIIKRQDEIDIILKNVKKNGLDYGQIFLDYSKMQFENNKLSMTDW